MPPSLFFAMRIRVLFFASYRDLAGTDEMTLVLPHGADVSALVVEVRGRGGALRSLPAHPAVAVNQEYAPEDRVLSEGDVVAFIPPVAGG
jgi:molybdopterin converting factor subunit 1